MFENFLIGCSGDFPSVSFHDVTLSDHFEISTVNSDGLGCRKNFRVVRVPVCEDLSRRFVSVSGHARPYPVLVYDVNSQQQIANCYGHRTSIRGLACISSTDSSNPKIVSSGYGDSQVLVFDAVEGTQLCALPNPPRSTYRILHVPEWNSRHDVFVGGNRGQLFHYDLTRPDQIIGRFVGHSPFYDVWGLSASVTRNILFSASYDGTVRLWSLNDYSCQITINLLRSAYSCCYMKERNSLIVGLESGVELHDIRRLSDDVPVQKVTVASHGEMIDIVQIDRDRFVCGCGDKSLVVCELPSVRAVYRTIVAGSVNGVCVFSECGISSSDVQILEERLVFVVSLFEGRVACVGFVCVVFASITLCGLRAFLPGL